MIKKWILAIAGLSFAFAFTSCDEQELKAKEAAEKAQKQERHHNKW
jgi:hypothetical protein